MTAFIRAALVLAVASGPVYAQAQRIPLASLDHACALIGKRLKSVDVAECVNAGLRTSPTPSVAGQPLLWRDYAPRTARANQQRILLIGGSHGDEFSSVSIIFKWMDRLNEDRFQPFLWRVMPCLNPDGLLSVPETRTNARGVDLNRNFPTPDWEASAMPYWERLTRRDPRRFPGPAPLSEPETRWLVDHIKYFRPHAIVSVHAPYGVLDYDGPYEPPMQIGFLRLSLLGIFPGSLGNYAGRYLGVPVITLELPRAGIMPTPSQVTRLWTDLLAWLDENLPDGAPPRNPLLAPESGHTMVPLGLPSFDGN